MFIVQDYSLAILFCVVTMLCWGSWGNTQKLASKTWRYEFFYWDYVIGVLLFSVFSAFTLGSFGSEGQGFLLNLPQADMRSLGSAFLGGIIFRIGEEGRSRRQTQKQKAEAEGRRKKQSKQSKFRTSHKGGDSAGDPPLPIPNREVKPRYADGTAKVGE